MVPKFGAENLWLTHKLPPEANIFRLYLDRLTWLEDHLVSKSPAAFWYSQSIYPKYYKQWNIAAQNIYLGW